MKRKLYVYKGEDLYYNTEDFDNCKKLIAVEVGEATICKASILAEEQDIHFDEENAADDDFILWDEFPDSFYVLTVEDGMVVDYWEIDAI